MNILLTSDPPSGFGPGTSEFRIRHAKPTELSRQNNTDILRQRIRSHQPCRTIICTLLLTTYQVISHATGLKAAHCLITTTRNLMPLSIVHVITLPIGLVAKRRRTRCDAATSASAATTPYCPPRTSLIFGRI